MSILAYLIGISLVLGSGALALFLWALRSGQYEDLDGAARRILFDGERGAAAEGPADLGLTRRDHITRTERTARSCSNTS